MTERHLSAHQPVLLALFAAPVVVAKIAWPTSLQMAGHTGLIWMAMIALAAGVVPGPGGRDWSG